MANVNRRTLLTAEPTWKSLQNYYDENKTKLNMSEMFSSDPGRFEKFSVTLDTAKGGDLLVDYSKNLINEDVMRCLLQLAKDRKVEEMRQAMFSGERINFTEDRAVLHIALRNRANTPILVDGKDIFLYLNRHAVPTLPDYISVFENCFCPNPKAVKTSKVFNVTDF